MNIECPQCHCSLSVSLAATGSPVTPKAQLGALNASLDASLDHPFDLSTAITIYCTEQRVTGSWSLAWGNSSEAYLRRFVAAGHPLTRQGVGLWRTELVSSGQATKTTNTQLTTLSTFCRWLVNRGDLPVNPCEGQNIRGKQHAPDEQRLAFEPSEVRALLNAVAQEGTPKGIAGYVWAMAYTGARNEEIAQLRVCDLTYRDSVMVFDLATMDDNQKRKNNASRRLVPVHTELQRFMGTRMALVPQNSTEGLLANLWGFVPGKTQRYSGESSRWVNSTLLPDLKAKGLVRDDKRLTLYSLRHAVATQLKHKGTPESLIAELVGHTNTSMTTGRYGKKYPVVQLQGVVESLSW